MTNKVIKQAKSEIKQHKRCIKIQEMMIEEQREKCVHNFKRDYEVNFAETPVTCTKCGKIDLI